jgi:acyl carrier protein
VATWGEVETGSIHEPTIGRPIANTQVYILDKELEPVPFGVAGEIYIGGNGLARGYLERPELTAERFIPNPYGVSGGARLYRTGDLARWRSDGVIDYIGRIDHQVKLRGFRIELGEIEAVLEQHPGVQSAAVIAREERLLGYVVPTQDSTPSITELRTFLQQKLPHYMVPHTITILDQWPLTPNGKINRTILPDPEGIRPSLAVNFLAPQTDVESAIAKIWQEVLGLEQVGVNDNFFDLGGDSLLMLQVQNKVQAALKKDIPLVELFEHATVRAMTEHFTRPPAEVFTLEDARERAKKQKEVLAQQRHRFKQQSGRM